MSTEYHILLVVIIKSNIEAEVCERQDLQRKCNHKVT